MLRGNKLSFHSLLLHSSGWEGLGAGAINSKKLSCFGHQANQILTPWMLEYMAHHSSCYAAERKIKEDKETLYKERIKHLHFKDFLATDARCYPLKSRLGLSSTFSKGHLNRSLGLRVSRKLQLPLAAHFKETATREHVPFKV